MSEVKATPEAIESAVQGVASAIIEDEGIWFTLGAAPSAADVVSAVAPRIIDLLARFRLDDKSLADAYMRLMEMMLVHARSK